MKRQHFKYNQDDILEIMSEALAVENGFGKFNSKSSLIIDNGEIFFIGVIGDSEDLEINKIDLDKLYAEMDYNGTHDEKGCYSVEEWKKISDIIKKRGTL